MKIYKAEQEVAGLVDLINTRNTVQLECSVGLLEPPTQEAQNILLSSHKGYDFPVTDDVMPFSSVLVSNIWNRNSVVFTAGELMKFYKTSEFKPVNWMHKGSEVRGNEIIGVMLKSTLIKGDIPEFEEFAPEDFIVSSSSTSKDLVDGKVHIKSDGIIWSSYFPTYANMVKKGFKDNTLYVSMEAFFDNFDYAFRETPNGPLTIVERNDKTAHYTKALSAFNGTGKAIFANKEQEIAVVPREFLFSGKGFVTNPANREGDKYLSILIDVGNKSLESQQKSSHPVYNSNSVTENPIMSTNNEATLQAKIDETVAQLDAANKKIANLQDSQLKADLEKAKAEKVEVEAALATANTQIADLTSKVEVSKTLEAKVAELETKITEITAAKATLDAELAEIKANEAAKTRLGELQAISADAYSEADLATIKGWNNETFEAVKAAHIKAGVSNKSQLTDQNVSSKSQLTDQTESNKTKLTEASDKTEDKYVEAATKATDTATAVEKVVVSPETAASDKSDVDPLAAARLLTSQIFTKN